MLTNFQKRKLINLFNIHDINANGQLEAFDFALMTDRFATLRGVKPDDELYQAMAQGFNQFWEGLHQMADADGDNVISYEEWWAWWQQIMDNGLYEQIAKPIGELMFSACFPDAAGNVSKDNFIRYYSTISGDLMAAQTVFGHISTEGSLSVGRLNTLLHEYFHSNDHSSQGNWMFGSV